jgi:hypothetical protein
MPDQEDLVKAVVAEVPGVNEVVLEPFSDIRA